MMKASSYATAVLAAALLVVVCQGKPWGQNSAAKFNNLFGLSTAVPTSSQLDLEHANNPLLSTRGGATKAEPGEEAEEEPAELYLPGLLDAVVSKSDLVRNIMMIADT